MGPECFDCQCERFIPGKLTHKIPGRLTHKCQQVRFALQLVCGTTNSPV